MSKKNNLKVVGGENEIKREPITFTGEWLSNKTVFMAMGDLFKGYFPHDIAFQLEKISRRLNRTQKEFADMSEAIIKKYAELDENGQPKKKMEPMIDHTGNPVLGADGKQKETPVDFVWKDVTEKNSLGEDVTTNGRELANIEFSALGERIFTIDVYKIPRAAFGDVKLTVAQWMSLTPILADPYTDDDKQEGEA